MGDKLHPQYCGAVGRTRLLTREEEIALATRAKSGDSAARSRLIEANQRLVRSIARHFARNNPEEFEDLVGYGNIGLIQGVDNFDPTRGIKLSTYASYWIKQSIFRNISRYSERIRIPDHAKMFLSRFMKVEEKLTKKLARQAPIEQTLSMMGVDSQTQAQIVAAIKAKRFVDPAPSQAEPDFDLEKFVFSKEEPLESDCHGRLSKILDALRFLTPREHDVVSRRFGIYHQESTLSEIATHQGVTRERIRQIETRAMAKIVEKIIAKGGEDAVLATEKRREDHAAKGRKQRGNHNRYRRR